MTRKKRDNIDEKIPYYRNQLSIRQEIEGHDLNKHQLLAKTLKKVLSFGREYVQACLLTIRLES